MPPYLESNVAHYGRVSKGFLTLGAKFDFKAFLQTILHMKPKSYVELMVIIKQYSF